MSEELPRGWVSLQIEDLTENPRQDIVDGPFGSNLKASEYVDKGVPVVRLQNIDRNRFLEKNIRFISSLKARELSRHSFWAGDIIITKLGNPVGKACIVPDSIRQGIIVADVVRARIDRRRACKEFVAFAINSPRVSSHLNFEVKGSTRPRVNLGHIRKLEIQVPPINEQLRIVVKLEKLLGRVDTCQQRMTKIPVILKRFRQSVLAAACSGRLTADWRETDQYENNLPGTWTMSRLSELSQLITKGASPKWQGVNYTESGVLFITSENVGWGKMLLGTKKFVESKINEIQPRSVLQNGDVLTNIVGASIGRSAIYESEDVANINQAVALIRLNSAVNRKYILHVLNSPMVFEHMEDAKVDVARANLSLKDVSNYPIPLPPLSEQHEIVRRVEALFALADQIEGRFTKAKARVDQLTQSILGKAFRGELVPQDPNDEPASTLLERIKAERTKGETEGKGGGKKRLKVNRKGKGR